MRFAKYSCTYSEFSFRKRDDNGNILIADSRVMASADTGGSIEDLCYAYVFESVVSPRVRGFRRLVRKSAVLLCHRVVGLIDAETKEKLTFDGDRAPVSHIGRTWR